MHVTYRSPGTSTHSAAGSARGCRGASGDKAQVPRLVQHHGSLLLFFVFFVFFLFFLFFLRKRVSNKIHFSSNKFFPIAKYSAASRREWIRLLPPSPALHYTVV
ncbi:unnamed protein product [Pleuronectes platessa]|uniref:Uncharacterized protein n=1 Tax=Pleuronectes platessa TaxID=8262 RepID=A0A9N7UP19_PLEPL|nr:unnamed protein product [Pleuronectes platessa]